MCASVLAPTITNSLNLSFISSPFCPILEDLSRHLNSLLIDSEDNCRNGARWPVNEQTYEGLEDCKLASLPSFIATYSSLLFITKQLLNRPIQDNVDT